MAIPVFGMIHPYVMSSLADAVYTDSTEVTRIAKIVQILSAFGVSCTTF